MIHHRIFPKGEYCHALISSRSNPNVLFQVRGLIYDVAMDPYNPQYLIKIIRFYDDINFIKRYMFNQKFQRDFLGHDTTFAFNRNSFNTREDFEQHLQNHKSVEKYMVVVDSVMCTKTLADSTKLYNEIESFLIEKSIRDIFDAVTRTQYRSGKYAFNNRDEFRTALKRFLKDKIDVTEEYLDDILSRPTFEDLDDIGA
jgi:hypothetical protein